MEIEKHIHIRVGEISGTMTWERAKEYAEKQGMRLPTRTEAFALIDSDSKRELPDAFWIDKENGFAYDYFAFCGELVSDEAHERGFEAVLVTDVD